MVEVERHRGLLQILLAVLVSLACTTANAATQVEVEIGETSVTLIGDAAFEELNYFTLTAPDRLVVDLYGVNSNKWVRRFELGRGFSELRVGDSPDRTRFVFDVSGRRWLAYNVYQQPARGRVLVAWRPPLFEANSSQNVATNRLVVEPLGRSELEANPLLSVRKEDPLQPPVSGRAADFEPPFREPGKPPVADADPGREVLAAPGSTWGEVRYPGSEQPQEEDNLIVEGAFEQGLDVHRLTSDSVLNLFAKINYTFDTEQLDYNRKLKLGLGIKWRHDFSPKATVSAGAKYEVERRFVDDRSLDGFQLFVNWFGAWDLQAGDGYFNFPGFTWGEVRYPGSQVDEEEDDVILEGSIEQGVDWGSVPSLGVFNTYAVVDYIADTEELDYNNSITFGIGTKFKRKLGERSMLQYGIELVRDQRWTTGESEEAVILFFNWSGWWDAREARGWAPN